MDFEETKQEIKHRHFEDVLQDFGPEPTPIRHNRNIRCLNFAAHPNGDRNPSMTVYLDDEPHLHCKACGVYWDALDLIAQKEGLADAAGNAGENLGEVVRIGAERFGIDYRPSSSYRGTAAPAPSAAVAFEAPVQEPAEADTEDLNEGERIRRQDLIGGALEKADHPDLQSYLRARGISAETAQRFLIGYHPNYPWGKSTRPVMIIPMDNLEGIIARNLNLEDRDKVRKAGKAHALNMEAIYEGETVHIVEGEIDMLTVEEAGGHAIGLPSASGAGQFMNDLRLSLTVDSRIPKVKTLIISTDNDDAGMKAAESLKKALGSMEFRETYSFEPEVIQVNISGEHKDPNEAWLAEPEAFKRRLTQRASDREIRSYEARFGASASMAGFYDGIFGGVNVPPEATGFPTLDRALGGGLYEGLTVIMAGTGMGKTTFALQMADYIATHGKDVLYFTLEMSTTNLIGRSVSRKTYEMAKEDHLPIERRSFNHPESYAKDYRGITNHARWTGYTDSYGVKHEGYPPRVIDHIHRAMGRYQDESKNLYIREVSEFTVEEAGEMIGEHIRMRGGRVPVVIVDYLQIMYPTDPRMDTRRAVDHIVTTLKRISGDYHTQIIALSSVARDHYERPLTVASGKESGGIEYGVDVALGLELQGVGTEEAKEENWAQDRLAEYPRLVHVSFLKHRNGENGEKVNFRYYPEFNYFEDSKAVPAVYESDEQPPVYPSEEQPVFTQRPANGPSAGNAPVPFPF